MDEEYERLELKYHAQEQQIARLRKEQQQMKDYITQFQARMLFSRTTMPTNKSENRSIVQVQDPSKYSLQLEKEKQNAILLLKNICSSIDTVNHNNHKLNAKSFDELDEEIVDLKERLKDARHQIKLLQVVKSRQEKAMDNIQREEDGEKLAKLVDELNKHKHLLQVTYAKRKQYDENLKNKRKQVADLEKKYKQQCSDRGQEPLKFAQFMERRERKDKSSLPVKQGNNKQIKSIRDIVKAQTQIQISNTKRNYEQLSVKRDIAVNSLQNVERKRERETKQLRNKLKALEEENRTLMNVLAETERQVQTASQAIDNNHKQTKKQSVRLPQI